jgi:hypothetical protein
MCNPRMAYPQSSGTGTPYAQPMSGSSSQSDVVGIGNLKVGALLGILFQLMVWIGVFIFYSVYSAVNTATVVPGQATSLPGWITVNTLYAGVGLLMLGFVLGIVTYIFFFLGFREVKRGAPDFGAPTTLMVIGLIGFIMILAGVGLFIGALVDAINNAANAATTSTNVGVDVGALLGGLALVGLGALLALIGVIGMVLGNWRAGTRYDESMLKIGGILTILPYVSIIGYILLLVGYQRAGNKLKSGWAPAGMGGYTMPPPAPGQWQQPPPPPQ